MALAGLRANEARCFKNKYEHDFIVEPASEAKPTITRWSAFSRRKVTSSFSDGMDVPEQLASRFEFAKQKSKLAGTIRGSYFAFKDEHSARPLSRQGGLRKPAIVA